MELIKTLHNELREIHILVASASDEALYAQRVLKAGARGFVMKDAREETLLTAFRRVLRGGLHVSPEIEERMLTQYAARRTGCPDTPLGALSDRELEVFEHLGRGHPTGEIAEAMLISPKTVDGNRTRIKEKLGLEHNTELIRCAVRWAECES